MSTFLDITLIALAIAGLGVVVLPRPAHRTYIDQMVLLIDISIVMLLNRLMVIQGLLERMVER